MDALTRERLGELLDRSILRGGSNEFELTFYESTKRVSLKVRVGEYYIRESLPLSELPAAVNRALEATDE